MDHRVINSMKRNLTKIYLFLQESPESEKVNWPMLLDSSCPNKLLYSLEIVHSIAQRSFDDEITKDMDKNDFSSDSDASDMEEESEAKASAQPKKSKIELEIEKSHAWSRRFVVSGGLAHFLNIFLSGCLFMENNPAWTQSHQECLASLLKLVKKFGTLKLFNGGEEGQEEVFLVSIGGHSGQTSTISTAYKAFRIRNKSTGKDEVVEGGCLSQVWFRFVNRCLYQETGVSVFRLKTYRDSGL